MRRPAVKKRVLVFGVLMAVFLVLAFSLGAARRSVTAGYDRGLRGGALSRGECG